MRVLAAHPVPDLYGADLMLLRALRAMRADGAEITVAVPEDGPLVSDLRANGIDVDTRSFPVLRKALVRPVALARLAVTAPFVLLKMRRWIRKIDPDVVYVNTLTLPHWVLAAKLAGRPVVCHVREAEDQLPSIVQRVLSAPLLLCTRIITNSHHTAAHLTGPWHRLSRTVEVVHNGFDFQPAPPSKLPAKDGELLLVGRLSPRKGQDVAIEALALLHRRGYPATLRLVGTAFRGYDWYVEALERAAAEHGLQDHVRFDGYQTDIPACQARADVVLVPSLVEPFGNVAVEALAGTRALVATSVGGLVEIVDDGETGLLVPPSDPVALADAVQRHLDDPAAATAMAEEGGRRVRDRFSEQRYLDGVADVLAAACDRAAA